MRIVWNRFIILLFCFSCCTVFSYPQEKIGINVEYVTMFSREFHFSDLSKYGAEWYYLLMEPGNFHDVTSEVDVSRLNFTSSGFPLEIPIQNAYRLNGSKFWHSIFIWTFFCCQGGAYYEGNYTIILEGEGEVSFLKGTWGVNEKSYGPYDAPGTYFLYLNETVDDSEGLRIVIQNSNVLNPISNVRFILPNHTKEDTFNRNFKDLYSDFSVLRMKDLQEIDSSEVSKWSDLRSKKTRNQVGKNGVAYEYIIDLANWMNSRPYFCIPHLADDEFMMKFAQLIHQRLDAHLDFFLEYSNEVWNSEYTQHTYMSSKSTGYHHFYANRTIRIWEIFEEEFGAENHRFHKVIGANTPVLRDAESILFNISEILVSTGRTPSEFFDNRTFLTIHHFFGYNVPYDMYNEGIIDNITYPEMFQIINDSLPYLFQKFREHKNLTDFFGIHLSSYEGGQGIPPLRNELDNKPVLEYKCTVVQNLEELARLYRYVYRNILEIMGKDNPSFANHYTGVKKYNKISFYGICERMDKLEICKNSTKFRALEDIMEENSLCFGVQRKNSSSVCSNHGVCTSFNNCTCSDGFYGLSCSNHDTTTTWDCFGYSKDLKALVCNNHGSCSSMNNCTCNKGWEGMNCSFAEAVTPTPTPTLTKPTPEFDGAGFSRKYVFFVMFCVLFCFF